MQFGMLGLLAEYERDLLGERTREGLARARRQGKRLGRRPVAEHRARKVAALLAVGTSINRIHRITRVSMSAIYRIKAEMAQGAEA